MTKTPESIRRANVEKILKMHKPDIESERLAEIPETLIKKIPLQEFLNGGEP